MIEIKDTGDCLHNEFLSKLDRKFKAESVLKKYREERSSVTKLRTLQISNYKRRRNRENSEKFNPFKKEQEMFSGKAVQRKGLDKFCMDIDDDALQILKALREGVSIPKED